MELISVKERLDAPIVLAMGFFDCVHMGHREIFRHTHSMAKALNAKTAAITFINNPSEVLNSGLRLVYTFDERKRIFQDLKLYYCLPFIFDNDFCATTESDFLNGLFNRLNIKGIVCGHDYHFGKDGSGTVVRLERECNVRNIGFHVVKPVMFENERVSTTLIKECLKNGLIERANKMLCEPYFLESTVVEGRGIGRTLSYPTINFNLLSGKIYPKCGVYVTETIIDGRKKQSLTNLGAKPTFKDMSVSAETFIKREDCDLYGRIVRVEFLKYIRDIVKFNSVDELQKQIKMDLECIK